MLREFLNSLSLTDMPLLAMVLFLAMFLAVLLRISQRARRSEYLRMSHLPLADDVHERSEAR